MSTITMEQPLTKARRGELLNLGKFKKNEVRLFKNPKTIARFPYGGSNHIWPRSYPATLLLVEKDEGQVGRLVGQLVNKIDEEVTASISALAGTVATSAATAILTAAGAGAAAGSVVPLVGSAVVGAVAAGIGATIAGINKARADDCFPPERAVLELDRAPQESGLIPGAKDTKMFSAFGGIYKVTYSWHIS